MRFRATSPRRRGLGLPIGGHQLQGGDLAKNVSGGHVSKVGRFPLRALPPRAEVRAVAADSVLLGVACLVSYVLTTRVLSLVYSVSVDDDALGGMWAVIATVFLFTLTSR